MRIVLRETWRSIRKNCWMNLVIVLQLAVCFFIATFLISYYFDVRETADRYIEKANKRIYEVSLKETTLIEKNSMDILSNAKACAHELKENTTFQYMIAYDGGNVLFVEDDLSHRSLKDYQKFSPISNLEGYLDDNGVKWSPAFHTFTLDYNAYRFLNLEVQEGRALEAGDFVHYHPDDVVPIMLGQEYAEYFKVGEQLKLEFECIVYNCKIIGFLKKNADATISVPLYLDRHVIFPKMELDYMPRNAQERSDQLWLYSKFFYAWVVGDKDTTVNTLAKKLNETASKYGMGGFDGTAQTYGTAAFKDEVSDTVNIITALIVILVFFILFSILINIYHKIDRNIRTYAIQLMNGARLYMIILPFVLEMALLLMTAVGVCVIQQLKIAEGRMGSSIYMFCIILAGIAFLILGIVSGGIIAKLKGLDTEKLMRSKIG